MTEFCLVGGEGEEGGSVLSGGAQGGEVPGEKLGLAAAALVMTLFFPFSLVTCCGALGSRSIQVGE